MSVHVHDGYSILIIPFGILDLRILIIPSGILDLRLLIILSGIFKPFCIIFSSMEHDDTRRDNQRP
jgi:hypothetical protein